MVRFGTTSLAAIAAISILAGTLATPAPARAATTRHVPASYATIQTAINAADPGDTVLVAPGTYTENLAIDEQIKLESSGGADVTTIQSAANGSPVVNLTLEAGEAPVVRGFTITGGWNGYSGGGISIFSGEPVIEHNRIVGNHAGNGSGVYAQSASPTIQDNLIADNTETYVNGWGGGIGLVFNSGATIRRNVITGNMANAGAGIQMNGSGAVIIERNVIRDNVARSSGGGIEFFNYSQPVITNNVIVGNTAGIGGGINWAAAPGDGAQSLVNNTIADNVATSGSAVYANGWDAGTTVRNNVFSGTGNGALVTCSPGAAPVVGNNDAWNPNGPEYADCPAFTGSNGNVSVNPKYVDAAGDDYHLRPDSALIDAGTNTGAPATDIDAESRPHDGDENGSAITDMGADEATEPVLLDPRSIDFGDLPLSKPSSIVNVTVRNYGTAPIDVDTVSLGGAEAADFDTTSDSCTSATLTAGQACTIGLRFTPSALGDASAGLVVDGPGAVGSRTVRLSGTGLDPVAVTPPAIDFGSLAAGGTDTRVTVTLANAGAAQVTVTTVSVDGPNAADFPVTNQTCTAAPVSSQGSCTMKVGFTPKGTGERTATLTIAGPAPVGTRTVALEGTGTTPSSGVSWGTIHRAGPAWTWTAGNALARTVQSGTQRLHVAYATNRIGGEWARDAGPYVGMYYTRSTSGSTWSTPTRITPTKKHAPWLGMAAAGSRVYAVWVTHAKWNHYSPTAPRVLYVRRNTSHGKGTAWDPGRRVTASDGRVDYPAIAASGNDVHIVYTDSESGDVRVVSSRDGLATLSITTIGATTVAFDLGYSGLASVAVDGSTVVVAWLEDEAGTIVTRISTDRGMTFGDPEVVGAQATGTPSVAVLGSRIAVGWGTQDEVVARQRIGGTWEAAKVVANLGSDDRVYPFGVVVKLNSSNRIGVAWAHRLNGSDWSNVRWAESADGGRVWFAAQTVASRQSTSDLVRNDWPSVVWASAGSRHVLWSGSANDFSIYRQFLRKGSGTPAGIATAAPEWVPSDDQAPTVIGSSAPDGTSTTDLQDPQLRAPR